MSALPGVQPICVMLWAWLEGERQREHQSRNPAHGNENSYCFFGASYHVSAAEKKWLYFGQHGHSFFNQWDQSWSEGTFACHAWQLQISSGGGARTGVCVCVCVCACACGCRCWVGPWPFFLRDCVLVLPTLHFEGQRAPNLRLE